MKASFPVMGETAAKSPQIIRNGIAKQLRKWFGKVPPYKVLSIAVSASWLIWVRLDVETTILDHESERG